MKGLLRYSLLLSFLCFASSVIWAQAPDSLEPVAPDTARIALTRDGQTVEVMPLDAWENPYRGQYGEWDYWIWEHYDETITFDELSS